MKEKTSSRGLTSSPSSTASPSPILIYCPVPDKKVGEKISQQLLKTKRIACANLISNMDSFYWWEGKITRDTEALLLCKTKKSLYKIVAREIRKMHPYQTPAILSLPFEQAEKAFLNWMALSLNEPMGSKQSTQPKKSTEPTNTNQPKALE